MLNGYDGAHLGYGIKDAANLQRSLGEFLHPREDVEHERDEALLSNCHSAQHLHSDMGKDFR